MSALAFTLDDIRAEAPRLRAPSGFRSGMFGSRSSGPITGMADIREGVFNLLTADHGLNFARILLDAITKATPKPAPAWLTKPTSKEDFGLAELFVDAVYAALAPESLDPTRGALAATRRLWLELTQ